MAKIKRNIGVRTMYLGLVLFFCLGGCTNGFHPLAVPTQVKTPEQMDHSLFTQVLEAFVDDAGNVAYARLKENPEALVQYLQLLAATDPATLSEDEQIAFWINAYNAYTLKLIIDKYPVSSILRTVGIPIPKLNMPWLKKIATVGGEVYTLDQIEHEILRKQFDEPRIHFGIVCASISCPALRREAYTGAELDTQLTEQALLFLNDPGKNQIQDATDTIRISKIFDWFEEDFTGTHDSVQPYLAQFFTGEVRETLRMEGYRIRYMDYDWGLNDQGSE